MSKVSRQMMSCRKLFWFLILSSAFIFVSTPAAKVEAHAFEWLLALAKRCFIRAPSLPEDAFSFLNGLSVDKHPRQLSLIFSNKAETDLIRAEAYLRYARLHYQLPELISLSRAIETLRASIQLDPLNPFAHELLGQLVFQQGLTIGPRAQEIPLVIAWDSFERAAELFLKDGAHAKAAENQKKAEIAKEKVVHYRALINLHARYRFVLPDLDYAGLSPTERIVRANEVVVATTSLLSDLKLGIRVASDLSTEEIWYLLYPKVQYPPLDPFPNRIYLNFFRAFFNLGQRLSALVEKHELNEAIDLYETLLDLSLQLTDELPRTSLPNLSGTDRQSIPLYDPTTSANLGMDRGYRDWAPADSLDLLGFVFNLASEISKTFPAVWKEKIFIEIRRREYNQKLSFAALFFASLIINAHAQTPADLMQRDDLFRRSQKLMSTYLDKVRSGDEFYGRNLMRHFELRVQRFHFSTHQPQ